MEGGHRLPQWMLNTWDNIKTHYPIGFKRKLGLLVGCKIGMNHTKKKVFTLEYGQSSNHPIIRINQRGYKVLRRDKLAQIVTLPRRGTLIPIFLAVIFFLGFLFLFPFLFFILKSGWSGQVWNESVFHDSICPAKLAFRLCHLRISRIVTMMSFEDSSVFVCVG